MMRLLAAVVVAVLFAWNVSAEDGFTPPEPTKEHTWLRQLAGEWETEGEAAGAPGEEPTQIKGTESARMIGGHWLQAEVKGEMPGMEFSGILTIGYDKAAGQYVGTWIDSMSDMMWKYTGSVDKDGKTLTLLTEGPSPVEPGKTCKFRESIELVDRDHKVFTSKFEKDGEWVTMLTVRYARKEK
jgi:hypothetical protein